MSDHDEAQAFAGLERSCNPAAGDWIVSAPAFPGLERIEARFGGSAFAPHRHDTYALGVTLAGVQTFHYRGTARFSTPGGVIVLHPDEVHDGGAGTDAGLRYRMLYLEPSLLRRCLGEDAAPFPFVADPVVDSALLRSSLLAALFSLDESLDDLFVDDFLGVVAGELSRLARHHAKSADKPAERAIDRAREYLHDNATRVVRSGELEQVTGIDRYSLARHFRMRFATSPYRFLMMRRLERARQRIGSGQPLADVAAATGFADQAHLTRHFKRAYGLTPSRWAGLVRVSRTLAKPVYQQV